MAAEREQWGTRLGFILAAVGGAVGFGNVVRFPSFVAQSGGAAFVAIYLVLVVLVGIPTFLAEMVVGREGQANPVKAFDSLGGDLWKYAGSFFVFTALVFLGYYIVLNGYVTLYLVEVFQFQTIDDPSAFFGSVVEGNATLVATFVTMAFVVWVVGRGVEDGLEKVSRILIPTLFLLILGLSIYGIAQEGGSAGLSFYLEPDPGAVTLQTLVDAMGQTFFSLGVGLGFVVTYGSYLDPDSDMYEDSLAISVGDTLVALVAGFMVFPLLFSAGLQEAVTGRGINPFSVLFVTLPSTFATIGGTLGPVLQVIFFVALFVAVLSSSIAVLAVPVSWIEERFEVPRMKASILAAEIVMLPAILSAYSPAAVEILDRFISTIALPLGGLAAVVFAGFFLDDAAESLDRGSQFEFGRYIELWWRTVLPVVLVVVTISGIVVLF